MIRTQNVRRGGFTLVELLVGISIFLALAGLVLMLYPGARDQDRVRYAVSDVSAHLRMAQSMAARDKAPRGIRFIVNPAVSAASPDPTNDLKTDPRWVTELQYIEQPLPLIPNLKPYTSANPATEPRVRFEYEHSEGGAGQPQAGTISPFNPSAPNPRYRHCYIENLKAEEALLIQPGCTLVMPVFSAWHKIKRIVTTTTGANGTNLEVELEVYPDAIMGGSTHAVTAHFAIYLLATPLVGEPTIPLPKNICVDLNASRPATGSTDFDVLFGPDGKLVNASNGQLFLWVRDFTKQAPYDGSYNLLSGPALLTALRQGGDQHIISVRASGSHGNNNVTWPDSAGNYAAPQDPYWLARQEIRQ